MLRLDADRAWSNRLAKLTRHRNWILTGAVLAGLAALIISLSLPKIFRATTSLLVSESKISPAVVNDEWQQYTLLPTYESFVDNDALIQKTIEHFRLDQPPYTLTVRRFRSGGYLDVRIPKNTRLLEIRVEFPNPQRAAELANFLAASAVEFNNLMTASDTLATQNFLKQRMDKDATRLAEAEANRLKVKEQSRLEDKEKTLNILLAEKEQTSTQLGQFRLGLAQNESRAKSLQESLKDEPRTLKLKKSITSDRYLEHATEKLGVDPQGELTANEEAVNTIYEELQRQLADAKAAAAGEKAGIESAQAFLAQLDGQINRLLADVTMVRSEIDKAEREYSMAREAYESASRDFRNASVTVSAKSQELKQVAPALVPERPVRPRVLLNTLLAVVLGLLSTSGIALAMESFAEMKSGTLSLSVEEEPVELHRS